MGMIDGYPDASAPFRLTEVAAPTFFTPILTKISAIELLANFTTVRFQVFVIPRPFATIIKQI